MIEALRNRKWEQGVITVENLIAKKTTFTSYLVSYQSEGNTIYALLNLPLSAKQNVKLPVIIVNHGYIPPDEYSTVTSYQNIAAYYASRGFLVLKPDYRGHGKSQGYAESGAFRTGYYAIDVMQLIASLPGYAYADPDKLFMYGHSMGGEVTLRVLEISNTVKAASLWAPVSAPFPESTFYFMRKSRPEYLVATRAELDLTIKQDEYASFSPLNFTRYIGIPLLLHHGTEDESVPYSWSESLAAAFDTAGVNYTFYTYEGENHNLSRKSYLTVASRDIDFFRSFIN